MRKFIEDLQFFKRDHVNLVHDVNARHVYPTALNHIYEIISRGIEPKSNIGIVDPIFTAYRLHGIEIEIRVCHSRGEIDSPLLFLPKGKIRRLFVQPDSEK